MKDIAHNPSCGSLLQGVSSLHITARISKSSLSPSIYSLLREYAASEAVFACFSGSDTIHDHARFSALMTHLQMERDVLLVQLVMRAEDKDECEKDGGVPTRRVGLLEPVFEGCAALR